MSFNFELVAHGAARQGSRERSHRISQADGPARAQPTNHLEEPHKRSTSSRQRNCFWAKSSLICQESCEGLGPVPASRGKQLGFAAPASPGSVGRRGVCLTPAATG